MRQKQQNNVSLPRRCPAIAGLLLAMTVDFNSRNVSY